MKKRIQLNIFLDSITETELNFLRALKAKSISINIGKPDEETSTGSVHDCGHDESGPCNNVVQL